MKRIVILGSSIAAVKAIEAIRAKDSESQITLFSFEGFLPYHRDLMPELVAQNILQEQIDIEPTEFYKKNSVDVILDKEFSRINFKRNKIFTEEKDQIDYDVLIVTDTPGYRFPDLKGVNKRGVFALNRLKDIDEIIKGMPFVETILIQSQSMEGLMMALAFMKRGKEVTYVSPSSEIIPGICNPSVSEWIQNLLTEKGLNLFLGNSISEILGNGDVKAARLDSGKVLAGQMILFDEPPGDFRFCADSILSMNQKIVVNEKFRTNLENVYALDRSCETTHPDFAHADFSDQQVAFEQGRVIGAAICGEDIPFQHVVKKIDFALEGVAASYMGQVSSQSDIRIIEKWDEETHKYTKAFLKGQMLIGVILINAEQSKDIFSKWINEKTPLFQTDDLILKGVQEETGVSEDFPAVPQSNDNLVSQEQVNIAPLTPESDTTAPQGLQ